ncbi:MAG: iron ABC transporter permease [Desulfobacteraceae bacterium]|nr:iron ABC transporter permease [Desulfobacteraceae bacterium]
MNRRPLLLNQLSRNLRSPHVIISMVLLVLLSYLVLLPMIELTKRTVTWTEQDTRISKSADPGKLTLEHWKGVVTGPTARAFFIQPLVNTLLTGLTAAVVALFLGAILAWIITRTDVPGKKWFRSILTLPYIIPSFALALAWETLFRSPRVGGQPGFYEAMFGVAPPFWLSYGPVPIIITMIIHYFPFALILVSGALATIDSQLEECAEIQGASRWTILRKITFPVVLPAFSSAFILTLGKCIGTFALPFLLGSPIRYYTLSTMLFTGLSLGFEAIAYIIGFVLIAMTALVVYLSTRILGKNLRKYETVGGKGFKGKPASLGVFRWPVFTGVAIFSILTSIFPIGLMLYQTLMLVNGNYGLDNLTSHFWIGQSNPEIAFGEPGVLHNPMILGASWNSIKLAAISSAICAILGLIIAYVVIRYNKQLISKILDQLAFLPFLFPGIALCAMYLSMFAVQRGPIPALYGTFTLLVIISVVNRLPYSVRTGTSAITQIGRELEEAAELQGAGWLKRFGKIVFPLAASGVLAGTMVSFIGIMRELSLIVMLITPETRVLMTLGFRYAEEDQVQLGNALILLVTAITLAGELIIWRLGKSRLLKSTRQS